MYFIQQWNHPEFIYLLIPLMISMLTYVYSLVWKQFRSVAIEQTFDIQDGKQNIRKFYIYSAGAGVVALTLSIACLVVFPQQPSLISFLIYFICDLGLIWAVIVYIRAIQRTLGLVRSVTVNNVRKFSRQSEFHIKNVRSIIAFLIGALLILALMGPEGGEKTTRLRRTPLNITVLLDLSRSMGTQDLLPSRLIAAKDEVRTILKQCGGDEVGLVYFTDTAIVQAPQTLDISLIQNHLEHAGISSMPTHGTDLSAGLKQALRTFDERDDLYFEDTGYLTRRVVLITDGESHSGDISEILSEYRKRFVHVDVIAIGTENGAEITDKLGRPYIYNNEHVVSKLQTGILKQIAHSTNGTFVQYDIPELAAQTIIANWDAIRIGTKPRGLTSSVYRVQLYYLFLYPAYALLLILLLQPLIARFLTPRKIKREQRKEQRTIHSNYQALHHKTDKEAL